MTTHSTIIPERNGTVIDLNVFNLSIKDDYFSSLELPCNNGSKKWPGKLLESFTRYLQTIVRKFMNVSSKSFDKTSK